MSDMTMLFDRLFDLIGKLLFSRQQDWERRRSAKILISAITVGVVLGLVLWQVMKLMNHVKR